jgi:DNA-binding SARP family transcriptional activator
VLRRLASALGLTTSLAGLPVVLRAAAGPPSLAGLPSWAWLRDGLRDQYLPIDPILHALGLLTWSLWGYAVIVAVLRVVVVLAARRRLVGAAALLTLSNLVTLAPVRGLLDASIGVSLLASSTRATPATFAAAPAAVVRTIQPEAAQDQGGWDRARPLLDGTRAGGVSGGPALAQPDLPRVGPTVSSVAARPDPAPPARPAAGAPTRTYTVQDGDSLWRIAEQQLGDGLRWREVWALNQGRDMGGGRIFRHAGLILPGWVLYLPAHEQPAPAAPPVPPESPERHDTPASTTAPARAPATSAPTPFTSTTVDSSPPHTGPQGADDGGSTSPTAQPAPAARSGPASRHGHGDRHRILELPTGEVVGITLAAAITAALAVARLRQRRRRIPTWPPGADSAAPPEAGPTTQRLVRFTHQYTKPADDEPAGGATAPPAPQPACPVDPRDPAPARVVVAERAGEELAVDLAGFGAITITGPRAADATRAAMVAMLAAGTPTDTQVLLAGGRLLPQPAELPGLRRAATLAKALDMLEAELVGRARMLELYEQPDFASYRQACPDDPLPALLLVADELPAGQAGRLLAIAEQGQRLGMGMLLAWAQAEGAARVELDGEGRVQAAQPAQLGAGQLVGARMLMLDPAQAADLLGTLAAARTDPQPGPVGQEPTMQHTAPSVAAGAPPREHAQPAQRRPTEPASAPPEHAAAPIEAGAEPTGTADARAAEPRPAAVPDGNRSDTGQLVTVRLLGAYQIRTGDGIIGPGLRVSARELLAYVLVHPDGVTIEQAVEALWPDTALGKERQQFWNALGNLRSVLREASGHPGKAIVHAHGRYRPEEGLFAVDLWRFQQAISQARTADHDAGATAALRAAVGAYSGSLLEGEPYGWAEPARQALRDQAVDALSQLAELRDAAGDDHGAQAALERAIQADPVAEECYRRLMRLHARQRRLDLAQRRYRQLKMRLEELDADPEPETTALLAALRRETKVL